MHSILISLVIINSLFQLNQATEIRMSSNDLLIKANITHEESNNTWYLAETVYFNHFIEGVIKIQKGDIEMQVHYNLNNSERIVILDNRAMEMESIRNFTWDEVQLPLSTIRLINKLLILGPVNSYSFLLTYNYQEFPREKAIKLRSNDDGQSSFWIYQFSASITPYVALHELVHITVSDYQDNPSITMKFAKFVSLDSILIGTGQQFFFGFNGTLTDHINQSTVDTQFGVTKDTRMPNSWIKYAGQEIGYEEPDGMRYGPDFTPTTNVCAIQSNNRDGSFNFASLSFQELWLTVWTFKYTKEILFPENISSDLILQNLQVERKLYIKINRSSWEYQLAKTQQIIFFGYTKLNYEPEHQVYTLNDKYLQDAKMSVLTLRVTPSKKFSPMETYSLINRLDELGENLKELICFKLRISYVRIKSVSFQFHSTHLRASVEIIERFNFVDLVRKDYNKLELTRFVNFLYSNIETRLKHLTMKSRVNKIISCNEISHGCIGITLGQPLPEEKENGSNCVIYNKDKALYKLVQEPTLRELKMSYKKLNQATLASAKLYFNLHVIDSSNQNDSQLPIDSDPFNEKVNCKNHFGEYKFLILTVALFCIVIGFVAFLSKLCRRTVGISSSPSISLVVMKDPQDFLMES